MHAVLDLLFDSILSRLGRLTLFQGFFDLLQHILLIMIVRSCFLRLVRQAKDYLEREASYRHLIDDCLQWRENIASDWDTRGAGHSHIDRLLYSGNERIDTFASRVCACRIAVLERYSHYGPIGNMGQRLKYRSRWNVR